MPTNPYFNNGHNEKAYLEQATVDSLNQEAIQIYGINTIYCPRTLVKEDELLGEDVLSAFNEKHTIEMYVDSVNQFGGQGDLLGKFGIQFNDTVDLIVSRSRFLLETDRDHPNEGDLIYFPLSKSLFEIKFVEHETPFYQLGNLYVFKLSCEKFQYSYEDFTTGDDEIDSLSDVLDNDLQNGIVNDGYADNNVIKREADEVLDFTESNPFGNP